MSGTTFRPPTVGSLLENAIRRLRAAAVPSPRVEAERLLGWVLGCDRGGVVARKPDPVDPEAAERFEIAVSRRESRCPLQYVIGSEEFLGLEFHVDPRVLIPRPETEIVAEAALECLPETGGLAIDLGTGSGCLAIAIAIARPSLAVRALDASVDAVEVARLNARRHGVADRIEILHADLADAPEAWNGRADVVVSNPPYVARDEWETLAPEVRDWEPLSALVPGPTGDEAYPLLARAAGRLLRPGGTLVAELGYRSAPSARRAAEAAGLVSVEVRRDMRDIERVLIARRP